MTRLELRLAVRRYLTEVDNAEQDLLDARAVRLAALEQADADVRRCTRCGAWAAGRCCTPFCAP